MAQAANIVGLVVLFLLLMESGFALITKEIRKQVSWTIRDFNMISEDDVIMVCVPDGKDSHTLLDILLFLKRIVPVNFDAVAVNLESAELLHLV